MAEWLQPGKLALQSRPAPLPVASSVSNGLSRPASSAGRRCWTVNGDYLGLSPTGIARHAHEVVAAMDRLIGQGHALTRNLDLRIVAPRPPSEPLGLDHIRLVVVPEFKPRLPQVWVQVQLPRHVEGGLLSLCNLAPLAVHRQIVCIHDLQTVTVPDSYGRLFRLAHRLILPRLGKRVALIATVSDASRQQIARHGVAPLGRIVVTSNGADHALRWRPGSAKREWQRERPFVFGIARKEAHKNTALFRKLAEPLEAMGIDILLAGEAAPAVLGGADRPRNLHLLGRIGDDDLAAAFGKALCFLFPSRTEGFGLPAVEAMACGCPVVVSAAPCLPEICGEAALYAAPDRVEDWTAAVRLLQARPWLRAQLVEAGHRQAGRYTWAAIGETYLRLMMELDAREDLAG